MTEVRRVYWDTSVFLCFFNRDEQERRKICEDILRHAQSGNLKLFTSTFTIAEVVNGRRRSLPTARRLTPDEVAKIRGMFEWDWLKKIDVDQRVAFKAQELARDYGLKPSDAIHTAAAVIWKLDVLQRWDRDFSKIAHLIAVEYPIRLTTQGHFEGPGFGRIGPSPEDFDDPAA